MASSDQPAEPIGHCSPEKITVCQCLCNGGFWTTFSLLWLDTFSCPKKSCLNFYTDVHYTGTHYAADSRLIDLDPYEATLLQHLGHRSSLPKRLLQHVTTIFGQFRLVWLFGLGFWCYSQFREIPNLVGAVTAQNQTGLDGHEAGVSTLRKSHSNIFFLVFSTDSGQTSQFPPAFRWLLGRANCWSFGGNDPNIRGILGFQETLRNWILKRLIPIATFAGVDLLEPSCKKNPSALKKAYCEVSPPWFQCVHGGFISWIHPKVETRGWSWSQFDDLLHGNVVRHVACSFFFGSAFLRKKTQQNPSDPLDVRNFAGQIFSVCVSANCQLHYPAMAQNSLFQISQWLNSNYAIEKTKNLENKHTSL